MKWEVWWTNSAPKTVKKVSGNEKQRSKPEHGNGRCMSGRVEDAAWKMIGGWRFWTKRRTSRSIPERGNPGCKEDEWKMQCGGQSIGTNPWMIVLCRVVSNVG